MTSSWIKHDFYRLCQPNEAICEIWRPLPPYAGFQFYSWSSCGRQKSVVHHFSKHRHGQFSMSVSSFFEQTFNLTGNVYWFIFWYLAKEDIVTRKRAQISTACDPMTLARRRDDRTAFAVIGILLPGARPSPMMTSSYGNISALLALCAGNSPVPDEFLSQRPVTRSFDVFFNLRLNKRLSKQSWGWWFEMPSRPLWRHGSATRYYLKLLGDCDVIVKTWWSDNMESLSVLLTPCEENISFTIGSP